MRFYEVQDYMTIDTHAYLSYFLSFSKAWFDSLPADLQEIVTNASMDAADYCHELMVEANTAYLKTIEDSGTEIYTLSEEETAAFKEACQSVYDEYRDVIGGDLLDRAVAMSEEMAEMCIRDRLMLLRRTESIYAQLMQTIVRQEGLDGICETLHSVTGQEIVILSASGKQILAKCVGEYGDAELDEDQMEFIRYFFEQSAGQRRLRELKPNQCGNLILGERHALCVPIYAQTEKLAYLLLSCTQWHIPDMDAVSYTHLGDGGRPSPFAMLF